MYHVHYVSEKYLCIEQPLHPGGFTNPKSTLTTKPSEGTKVFFPPQTPHVERLISTWSFRSPWHLMEVRSKSTGVQRPPSRANWGPRSKISQDRPHKGDLPILPQQALPQIRDGIWGWSIFHVHVPSNPTHGWFGDGKHGGSSHFTTPFSSRSGASGVAVVRRGGRGSAATNGG